MLMMTKLTDLELLFMPLEKRAGRGVFFVRVDVWNAAIKANIWRVHEAARARGAIIEEHIQNPDSHQLNYFTEVLGGEFHADRAFIETALIRWTPRLSAANRSALADAMLALFDEQRRLGKTDSILRNVYTKMMCWLYYRFENVAAQLGENDVPKVLYAGSEISGHELLFLRMLGGLGADIVLLETAGDAGYLKQDPESRFSQLYHPADGGAFPADFSLKTLRDEMTPRPAPMQQSAPHHSAPTINVVPQPASVPMRTFTPPRRTLCTNAWMKQASYEQIATPPASRGNDANLCCNAFVRVRGVADKTSYVNELYRFYMRLKNAGRSVLVIEGEIPKPTVSEVEKIHRRTYRTAQELIGDLAGNIPPHASLELQRSMQQAFCETVKELAAKEPNLNRLMNAAVYLLCWLRRYQGDLFHGWTEADVPCAILLGGCRTSSEAAFLRMLARLPVDVLALVPDLNAPCLLESPELLEVRHDDSLPLEAFPREESSLTMRTVAAHAEDELTGLLYSGGAMYRDHQFAQANAIVLQTTFDELFLLWDQELKYRPNFSTSAGKVNMPVIYAKISGVEGGKELAYWQKIKALQGENTFFVKQLPMLRPGDGGKYQQLAAKALKGGRIRREVLKTDPLYPFGLLREAMQDHIIDKVQLMLDRKLIKGIGVDGTEYTVLATVLGMRTELVRMLQGFDFTKKNPKIVCVSTGEESASLKDTILLTFLSLAGFDVALFVPTGYQTVERYLNGSEPVEHHAGEYMYDLQTPDLSTLPSGKGFSWLNNLFRRK